MKTAFCICSQPSLSNDPNTESVEGWDEDPSVLLREPRFWFWVWLIWVLPSKMSYHLQALRFLKQITSHSRLLDALTCSGG